jgi:hypothetical protein
MARFVIFVMLWTISAYQIQPTADGRKGVHDATESKHDVTAKPHVAQPPTAQQTVVPPQAPEQKVQITSIPTVAVNAHDSTWEILLTILTGLLVIVGGAQIIMLWRTVKATQDNAEAARLSAQGLRDSERAWVAVKRVGNPPENWVAEVSKGYVPGIVFEFEVHGKTVVRIVESRFALAIVPVRGNTPMPEPDLPLPPDYSAADSYNIAGENRMVVPPGGTFQMRCFLRPSLPTEKQLAGLRDREVLMCAYGYVKYLDSFGKSRETRACYVYDFIWGGVLTSPDGEILNPSGFRVGNLPEYNKAT